MEPSRFMTMLRSLARMQNRDMTPEAFELFEFVVLEPYGEELAQRALQSFVRGTARGFPMPGELVALIEGPKLQPKQIASETATRMLGTISRRGYTWTDTYRYDGHETFEHAVRAEIGEEAIPVLNMCGGWQAFCQQFDEGTNGNARAQLRDLLETQIVRQNAEQLRASLNPPRNAKADELGEYIAKQKALNAAKERSTVEHDPATTHKAGV
jgi:hypothetical protein